MTKKVLKWSLEEMILYRTDPFYLTFQEHWAEIKYIQDELPQNKCLSTKKVWALTEQNYPALLLSKNAKFWLT